MSFILDALKKSETERQRADAPALYEMKMAPPRRGVATWLIVLAGLLVINIVVLTVVLLRGAHGTPPQTDAGTPAAPVAAPAPVAATPTSTNPPPAPGPTVVGPGVIASATVPGSTPVPAATPPAEATQDPAANPAANRPSDDDAPAVDAPHGTAGGGEVPSYQQAAGTPGANMPELTLDLHAYSANPADRFIFLNMTKLKEGQTSPQGVRVESITPDGAILSWQGSKFLLQRQ